MTSVHNHPFHLRVTLYQHLAMPKIRDLGPKADLFEVTTTQTRRGKRITQVPVKESHSSPPPSRSASPSKKRAWSPGMLEPNDDNSQTDQRPKRSRTSGKVRIVVHIMSQ